MVCSNGQCFQSKNTMQRLASVYHLTYNRISGIWSILQILAPAFITNRKTFFLLSSHLNLTITVLWLSDPPLLPRGCLSYREHYTIGHALSQGDTHPMTNCCRNRKAWLSQPNWGQFWKATVVAKFPVGPEDGVLCCVPAQFFPVPIPAAWVPLPQGRALLINLWIVKGRFKLCFPGNLICDRRYQEWSEKAGDQMGLWS